MPGKCILIWESEQAFTAPRSLLLAKRFLLGLWMCLTGETQLYLHDIESMHIYFKLVVGNLSAKFVCGRSKSEFKMYYI